MADNINVPGVGSIPLPEWAKDSTLRELGSILNKNNKVVDVIQDLMDDQTADVGVISAKISQLGDTDQRVQDNIERQQKDYAKGIGKVVASAADKFNDTSKPLTSIVNMGGDLADGAKSLMKNTKLGSKISKAATDKLGGFMDRFGGALGVAGDGAALWAGMMAGKAEQFATAQQSMIDTGAVMFNSTQAFEDLRQAAFDSGITYLKLTEIAGNFGPAMTALGGNTSNGTVQFARLSEKLNETSDQFGDFGMTNEQLSEGFAEYLETQRMTGNIDRTQAGFGDKLISGYQELLIEQGSYAAATAFSRKQLMDAQKRATAVPDMAAAIARARRKGNNALGDLLEQMGTQVEALKDEQIGVPSLMGPISEALSLAANAMGDNPEDFNLTAFLQQQGYSDVVTALNSMGSNLIEDMENAVKNGGVQDSEKFIMDLVAQIKEQGANMKIASGAMDGIPGTIRRIQSEATRYAINVEQASNLSEEEKKLKKEEYKKNLKGAGGMTKSMNDMQEAFLKVQDTLTMNMSSFASVLDSTTSYLSGDKEKSKTTEEQQQKFDEKNDAGKMITGGSVNAEGVAQPGPNLSQATDIGNSRFGPSIQDKVDKVLSQREENKKQTESGPSILDSIMNFFGYEKDAETDTKKNKPNAYDKKVEEIEAKKAKIRNRANNASTDTSTTDTLSEIEDKKLEAIVELDEIKMRMTRFNKKGGFKNKKSRDSNSRDKKRYDYLIDQVEALDKQLANVNNGNNTINDQSNNVVLASVNDSTDNRVSDVESIKSNTISSNNSKDMSGDIDSENNEENSLQNAKLQLQYTKELKSLVDNFANNAQNRRVLDTMYTS